jgi:FkbM family methyltransferase
MRAESKMLASFNDAVASNEQKGPTSNLALNKPASQSSTSQWSRSRAVEEDARNANNGSISGGFGFHTEKEQDPWWQVDLRGAFFIREIVIFNRHDHAYRLTRFSILGSLDGREWKRFFRKIDGTVFGNADNKPYVIEIADNQPARYVRVRLDGTDYLHFDECQVFGDPVDAIALRQVLEQQILSEQKRLATPEGRTGHMTEVGGFTVFVDTERYAPGIVSSLDSGSYEGRERQLATDLIQPADRVLEVGTALGIVSMTAASIVGAENVLTFDANPDIVEDARQNFRRNGLSGIKSCVGILKPRSTITHPDETINFYVDQAFWASRLAASPTTAGILKTIQVPVLCLEDEINSHSANVLICDIEGGEVELLSQANLTGVRFILMETHYWAAGETATDNMIRKLILEGFSIHLGHSGHQIMVLRR